MFMFYIRIFFISGSWYFVDIDQSDTQSKNEKLQSFFLAFVNTFVFVVDFKSSDVFTSRSCRVEVFEIAVRSSWTKRTSFEVQTFI